MSFAKKECQTKTAFARTNIFLFVVAMVLPMVTHVMQHVLELKSTNKALASEIT